MGVEFYRGDLVVGGVNFYDSNSEANHLFVWDVNEIIAYALDTSEVVMKALFKGACIGQTILGWLAMPYMCGCGIGACLGRKIYKSEHTPRETKALNIKVDGLKTVVYLASAIYFTEIFCDKLFSGVGKVRNEQESFELLQDMGVMMCKGLLWGSFLSGVSCGVNVSRGDR